MLAAHLSNALTVTITASSSQVSAAMLPNVRYALIATVACWVGQGSTLQVAAIGGASSAFIPASVPIAIWGDDGAFLSVIGTTGSLTLIPVAE